MQDYPKFLPHIEFAIDQARQLNQTEERWPNQLGTQVYRLVEQIIR